MDSFLPMDIAVFHLTSGLISSERLIMVSLQFHFFSIIPQCWNMVFLKPLYKPIGINMCELRASTIWFIGSSIFLLFSFLIHSYLPQEFRITNFLAFFPLLPTYLAQKWKINEKVLALQSFLNTHILCLMPPLRLLVTKDQILFPSLSI